MNKEELLKVLAKVRLYCHSIKAEVDYVIGHSKLDSIIDITIGEGNEVFVKFQHSPASDKVVTMKLSKFIYEVSGSYLNPSSIEKIAYTIHGIIAMKQPTVIEGQDIKWYYDADNYKFPGTKDRNNEYVPGTVRGTLSKSCMRYKPCMEYMEMYTKNPDKIKLLVYTDPESGQVTARALLWLMDNGAILLDRVYYTYEYEMISMMEYGISKNYIVADTMYWATDRVNIVNPINRSIPNMTLKLGYLPSKFPYVDSVRYFNPNTGELNTCSHKAISLLDLKDNNGNFHTVSFQQDYYHNFYTWKLVLPTRLGSHGYLYEERFRKEEMIYLWDLLWTYSMETGDQHLIELKKRMKSNSLQPFLMDTIIGYIIDKIKTGYTFPQFIGGLVNDRDQESLEKFLFNQDMVKLLLSNSNVIIQTPKLVETIYKNYGDLFIFLGQRDFDSFSELVLLSNSMGRINIDIAKSIFKNYSSWKRIRLQNMSALEIEFDNGWTPEQWYQVLSNNRDQFSIQEKAKFVRLWNKYVPEEHKIKVQKPSPEKKPEKSLDAEAMQRILQEIKDSVGGTNPYKFSTSKYYS